MAPKGLGVRLSLSKAKKKGSADTKSGATVASMSSPASVASSSASSGTGGRANGVPTHVGNWFQLYDEETGRFYFYNPKTKTTAWGLPLRDCIPEAEVVPHGKVGTDDWECCIDPASGKKFYQSVKYRKVQWTIPLVYRARLSKLPYFSARRVSVAGAKAVEGAARPKLQKQMSLPTIISKISIEDVLEDSVTCAAFHRFLVATHAEENLLFWGAAEVFRKGEWKGMKALGVEDAAAVAAADDEGAAALQQQLTMTRASVRVGVPLKRMSASREARMIYDKFLKPNAPLEVCVDRRIADKVEEAIASGRSIDDRSLFVQAQEEVLRNMEEDLLPRFLKAGLSEAEEEVGSGDHKFATDQVVRTALKRLAGMSTE